MIANIELLSPELQSQIAAGEVVERPASIVKELVENSLDAHATHIEISLWEGGLSAIEVKDDGIGLNRQNLEKAVQSHATSKLRSFEDLSQIQTFGFRGEALASIASVARMVVTSFNGEESHGWRWKRETPQSAPDIAPFQCAKGTTIEVTDLFSTVPARRRFLKRKETEWGHCYQWLARLALIQPGVSFTIRKDGKIFQELSKRASLDLRFLDLKLGDGGKLYVLDYPHSEHGLQGWLQSPPRSSFASQDLYLYVNQRFVQDRLLRAAVLSGLKGVIETSRYPVGLIHLSVPASLVDVNVHPFKTEVRFVHGPQVFQWIEQAMRDWGQSRVWLNVENQAVFSRPTFTARNVSTDTPIPTFVPSYSVERAKSRNDFSFQPQPVQQKAVWDNEFKLIGQWQTKYILLESNDELWVCDQHAVHERLRYERLKNHFKQGTQAASQLVLIPEFLSLNPTQLSLLKGLQSELQLLGWRLTIKDSGVELAGIPSDLPSEEGLSALREILQNIQNEKVTEESSHGQMEPLERQRHLIWATQSCKGAIKTGDHLTKEQMEVLCREAHLVQASAHCPHGRPSWVKFNLSQMDQLFHRSDA